MQIDPERTARIRQTLSARYPQVKTQLNYRSPFQLLVATILSAQCTDRQVNRVTASLFKELSDARAFIGVPLARLEQLIRPTGFYRNKAKHIKQCAQALVDHHNGEVPADLADLVKLPGVGRKTANVVLGAAFGIPGIVVDTHVARISRRLALSSHKDPEKIECDLMKQIPASEWSDFSLHVIYFGREICKARKPDCPDCPLEGECGYAHKTEL